MPLGYWMKHGIQSFVDSVLKAQASVACLWLKDAEEEMQTLEPFRRLPEPKHSTLCSQDVTAQALLLVTCSGNTHQTTGNKAVC